MLAPISGKNDPSVRPTAPAASSGTQIAQAAASATQAVTGITGSATSDAVDAALIAFASQKTTAPPQAPNRPAAPIDDNPITAIPSDAVAQLLKNLQSLGTSVTTGSAHTGNGGTEAPTVSPDLTDDPDSLASLLQPPAAQPNTTRARAHADETNPTQATEDIANGTTPEATDPLGSFMQQVALAAYASGYASGIENPNTLSTTGFNA